MHWPRNSQHGRYWETGKRGNVVNWEFFRGVDPLVTGTWNWVHRWSDLGHVIRLSQSGLSFGLSRRLHSTPSIIDQTERIHQSCPCCFPQAGRGQDGASNVRQACVLLSGRQNTSLWPCYRADCRPFAIQNRWSWAFLLVIFVVVGLLWGFLGQTKGLVFAKVARLIAILCFKK